MLHAIIPIIYVFLFDSLLVFSSLHPYHTVLSLITRPFKRGRRERPGDYFMRMREIFCLNIVYSTASSVGIIECAEMEYVDRHLFTTQAACA